MDDTVAMQDTNNHAGDAAGAAGASSTDAAVQQLAALKLVHTIAPSQPSTPQQASDAASVTSESSNQEQQIFKLRPGHGAVDVDAAKQAALSALAGLDLTTTKANLDASKAAAATARANGEVPSHTRKSSLRSVSCRQLGASSTSSSTPTAGKAVGFDDTVKGGTAAEGSKPAPGQWRGGIATGQPRRTNRGPASRCISLPHVLQGRAGMNSRLAATYAQDAALQQQLQLLSAGPGIGQQFAALNQVQHAGHAHPIDTLSLFQMQNQINHMGGAPAALLAQHGFGTPSLASLDDSAVSVQPSTVILQPQGQQQLQQLQPQQARLAAGWNAAAQPQTLTRWGSGQITQQAVQAPANAAIAQAQAANANVALLAQLQASSGTQSSTDALWMAPASAALQLSTSRPQGVMMQPTAVSSGMSGIPGLQQQQQLMAASLQPSAVAGGGQPAGGVAASGNALLDSYQSVSWSVLAAAQGEAALRDQLLTELVLLLTMLHTLNNVLKGSMAAADALGDFSYLAQAARRHMATFNRLSQAGNVAVQLLAMITPLALRHINNAELYEAAFLVLDTLALANRDVANVVTQQRMTAAAGLCMQLPVEQLLQQQTLGLHWITNLAAAVSRNKAVLESMSSEAAGQGAAAAGGTANLVQNTSSMGGGSLMPVAGLPLGTSQPMMMAPNGGSAAALSGNALSPSRKTPLATYFEETAMGQAAGGATAAAVGGSGGGGGVGSGLVLAHAGPGAGLSDPLLTANGLPGVQLAAPAVQDDATAASTAQLGYGGMDKLSGLGLSVTGGQLQAAAPGTAGGGAGAGTYSPLGGVSLFGAGALLAPGSSGPSSAGTTSVVGV